MRRRRLFSNVLGVGKRPIRGDRGLGLALRWVANLRNGLVSLFLIVACGCAPTSQPAGTPGRAADLDAIRMAKVETWRQLYRNQDSAGLNDFLLDDFIVIGADGSLTTKAEEVEWL